MQEFIEDKTGRLDIRAFRTNLLNFNFLPLESFHSTFHLYEDHMRDYMLTDLIELHFIEFPKFRAMQHNLHDPLHRWLLFMEENLTEEQLEELIQLDPMIKKTEERLEWLSSDEETRRRYEMRENSRIELNSLLYEVEIAREEKKHAKEEGRIEGKIEGIAEGKIEVAKEMLRAGMSHEAISSLTKLPLKDIQHLADEL